MTLFTAVLIFIQLFFWCYFHLNLIKKAFSTDNQVVKTGSTPVSVIICAKNELPNLKDNLGQLMAQNHRPYELFIADDFSTDNTSDYLKQIDDEWGILRYYKVKQNKVGKKQALKEALALVRHKWCLLTDADCQPISPMWVRSMISKAIAQNSSIVLGYSPTRASKQVLGQWIGFETWLTAVQYLSFASRGLPYMGVGRNLLYDKTLIQYDTLSKYDHLSSGDDDLTIMQIANSQNTSINLDPKSFVYTDAAINLGTYWRQKTRHYSTATSYKPLIAALLASYAVSHFLAYVGFISLLFLGNWQMALLLYSIRMLVILPVVHKLKIIMEAPFSLWKFLLFDFIQNLYYMMFSFAVIFPQKNKW